MFKKFLLSATVSTITILSVNSIALSDDNLKTTARIYSLKNSVQIKYGNNSWKEASINQIVKAGASIRTGPGSKAYLIYNDGTITNIGSRSYLTILDKKSREVKISSGNFWYKVTKKSYGLKIFIPNAVATITGTEGGVKVEDVEDKNQKTLGKKKVKSNITIAVAEGTISVFMNDKNHSMSAGDRVSYSTGSPTVVDFKNIGAEKVNSLFESSN